MLFVAQLEGLDNSWLTSLKWDDGTWNFVDNATEAQQWYCGIYWVITTVGMNPEGGKGKPGEVMVNSTPRV